MQAREMAKESTSGMMVVHMKGTGEEIEYMDMVYICGQTVELIKVMKKIILHIIGQWKENFMNGKGVHNWPDGRIYEGEYLNDKKHGYGVYKWSYF